MKTVLLGLLVLFAAGTLAAADNLLRNSAFSQDAPNTPAAFWRAHPADAGARVACDGHAALRLTGLDGRAQFLLQNNLDLRAGVTYRLSADLKAPRGVAGTCYVEANKPVWKAFTKSFTGSGNWETVALDFRYDALEGKPYAVFRLNGAGELLLRNPSLTVAPGALHNGDFESGLAGWEGAGAITASGGAHRNSLRLHAPRAGKSSQVVQSGLAFEPGERYELSYEVKGSEKRELVDSMGATWFRVYPLFDGKSPDGSDRWQDSFYAWQTKKVIFQAPSATGKLICEVRGPGECVIDNIRIRKTAARLAPLRIVYDPPFALLRGFVAGTAPGRVTGLVMSDRIPAGTVELALDGRSTVVTLDKGAALFALDAPAAPGEYTLTAQLRPADGAAPVRISEPFRVVKPEGRVVSFRDDKIMLIDGKPFFPVGVWGMHGSGTAEEKAKLRADAGFNLWLAGNSELDLAADHGMFLLAQTLERFPEYTGGNPARLEKWKAAYAAELRKIASHPALAGYLNSDEPAWRGIGDDKIRPAYRFVRELDPMKPILQNEAPRGEVSELRNYLDTFDIYGIDIYPVPAPNSHSALADKMMTSVGGYTDLCHEVVYSRKPVWMTLQAYAWGVGKRPDIVYPTHDENRFMAYNAILHGATGLLYYGVNEGRDAPEFIRTLSRTLRELRAMEPVLVARTVDAPEFKASAPELRSMVKQVGKIRYYLVANESGKELDASFTGNFPEKLHVLFEDRTVPAASGAFRDRFAPYGVHVYATAPELPPHTPVVPAKVGAKAFRSGEEYKRADWIWYPGKSRVVGDRAWFFRTFRIDFPIAKAELFITADDYYAVTINGVLSGDQPGVDRSWEIIDWYDVTAHLRQGENRLEIRAADAANAPCGVLAMLKVTGKNGETLLLPTDAAFEAASAADGKRVAAEVLGRFGCAPWGNKMRVLPNDNTTLGKIDF